MKIKISRSSEQGMTLVEVIVALVILVTALAAAAPHFLDNRLNTIRNEIRLGGVAVSQRVMDELRRTRPEDFSNLPMSGSTSLPSASPLYSGGPSITSLNYAGKNYRATITYCQTTAYCDADFSRHIQVQVSHGGQNVYQVETIYTKLE